MPQGKTDSDREAAWFGNRRVDPESKAGLVGGVFDSVADRYDLMNDLMSGGVHRLWKNRFVQMMRPAAEKPLLDVAGGTGDIAFRYLRAAGAGARVTVCDINARMLERGKARAIDRGHIGNIDWIEGNAEDLPFDDSSQSLYSIAFGLRNVTHIDAALGEAARVLRPGGQFFCLEFSRVNNDLLRKIYDGFSFRLIPEIGRVVTGDKDSYRYLVESIRRFPRPEDLCARMRRAGFDAARHIPLSGGIAAVHIGLKY